MFENEHSFFGPGYWPLADAIHKLYNKNEFEKKNEPIYRFLLSQKQCFIVFYINWIAEIHVYVCRNGTFSTNDQKSIYSFALSHIIESKLLVRFSIYLFIMGIVLAMVVAHRKMNRIAWWPKFELKIFSYTMDLSWKLNLYFVAQSECNDKFTIQVWNNENWQGKLNNKMVFKVRSYVHFSLGISISLCKCELIIGFWCILLRII